eukprot:SAG31_NODE_6005_length_2217_cov_10.084986_1_plen_148_part_10
MNGGEGEEEKEEEEEKAAAAASPAPANSALRATFDKYDTNGDGVLDEYEVAAMMLALGFDATKDYLKEMIEVFGAADTDSSGAIEFSEFPMLWEHLGGDQTVTATESAPANSALRTTFDKYDVDRDGMLNQKEVLMMMQDLRFEVDGE